MIVPMMEWPPFGVHVVYGIAPDVECAAPFYVGVTWHLDRRATQHEWASSPVAEQIAKLDASGVNCRVSVLATFASREEALEHERLLHATMDGLINKRPGTVFKPITFSVDDALLKQIDDEAYARRVRDRSKMARMLFAEALHRARVRRDKGQPMEVSNASAGGAL